LLTYDKQFVISDYLGDGGYLVAKRWSFGPFSVSRSKAIPAAKHFYKIGIDFSTDQGDGNVYHWTVRVLPKIKLVRLFPASIPLVFCQEPIAMQIESLKIFNVKNSILVLSSNEVSAFETYLLVEGPWAGAHLPQLDFLRENFDAALPIISQNHARQINGNRLFIYREEKWARHLSNRNEIKEYLSGQGFKMYSIDNISIQETVAIFSSADEIVFEHGAAGVWLIFAKPGIKIIELLPERNHITSKTIADFFYWQCQALKQNHQYILGQVNSFKPRLTYSIELKKLQQLIDV
jgi:capsular polysaccharide biosynthesis protein